MSKEIKKFKKCMCEMGLIFFVCPKCNPKESKKERNNR
ncbi:hypothetical protein LCGC14_0546490 [marine sediment metagenome]|uniref:Uncharacterized protein n=1 Tax=marine sediment metagenome TaxID=412755 RepID=A0A0F9RVY4_9ZZZZ